MVTIRALAALGLAMACRAAQAADEPTSDLSTPTFSGEVGVVSDYVYRGVSYSDAHPALQASVSLGGFLGGLHVDGWVSSIDFGPGDPAKAELWGTVGYAGGGDLLTYDAGLEYATYPGAPAAFHYSYVDGYAALGAKAGVVDVKATVRYSPDYSGATGRAAFADLTAELPVAEIFTLGAGLGHADLKPAAGGKYNYWNLGVSVSRWGFTASVRYHGNDLKVCTGPCGDRVVFGLSRSF